MKITVILCTFDRCLSLAQTLKSVAASVVPDSVTWEVLVVDNNSADRTRQVVDEISRQYPGHFRYVFESNQGKSYALNAGIRQSSGEILAFIDDDVTVEPDWLRNLTAALNNDEWAGVGGRTLLAKPFSPPTWLALHGRYGLGGIFAALFDFGDSPRQLDTAPFGANMAYKTKMFEEYGLFRTDLGPSPSRKVPRPNEDTEFGRRLMAAGKRLRYEPQAVVYHPVPEERINKKYFLDWWFDYGRAEIREAGTRPAIWGVPRRYLSVPKMLVVDLPSWILRWAPELDPQRRFFWKTQIWRMAGQIFETHHQ